MSRFMRNTGRPVADGLIALIFGLFVIFLFGGHLINAPQVDPDHPFDTQATIDRLGRILGDEAPHPVDSDASDAVIQRLISEIETLGFRPLIDDAFHCSYRWRVHCARVRNIGFWVTEPGTDAIMIASHHDSVPTGPGAADDGMGISSSLEIARIMKARLDTEGRLPRPLYVLITDAEEIGLVGASRFVHHNAAARLVNAVVSLEARGNRGVASMFETSVPNGRDLAALHTHRPYPVRGPVASSLSVDIYRAMPNGTDVTEYLTLGMDAANYAMVGRPSHYHTRHDDMAHLSENAVFHIGASALSAVEGFMTVDQASPDTDKVYADILGFGVIALPAGLAQPLVGLALLLCGIALFRMDRTEASLWRVLLMPVLMLIVGVGLAVLAGMAVGALRAESAYGTAWPIALRGLLLSLSLLGAILIARWLYRPLGADRFIAGAWVVMMALGFAASFVFFGAIVLFALPALFVIPGALLLIVRQPKWARALFILAAIITLCLGLAMYVMAETALFVETSAPLTGLVIWVLIVSVPLAWRRYGSTRRTIIGASIAVLVFGIASLIVPAYSEALPNGSNLFHISDRSGDAAYFAVSARDPLPASIAEVGDFTEEEIQNFSRNIWRMSAPAINVAAPTLDIISDQITPETRQMKLLIRAPDADVVRLFSIGSVPDISVLSINDVPVTNLPETWPSIECTGRTCRNLTIDVTLSDNTADVDLSVWSITHGLGPSGDALIAARPDWMVAQHDGDRRIQRRTFTLTAPD